MVLTNVGRGIWEIFVSFIPFVQPEIPATILF